MTSRDPSPRRARCPSDRAAGAGRPASLEEPSSLVPFPVPLPLVALLARGRWRHARPPAIFARSCLPLGRGEGRPPRDLQRLTERTPGERGRHDIEVLSPHGRSRAHLSTSVSDSPPRHTSAARGRCTEPAGGPSGPLCCSCMCQRLSIGTQKPCPATFFGQSLKSQIVTPITSQSPGSPRRCGVASRTPCWRCRRPASKPSTGEHLHLDHEAPPRRRGALDVHDRELALRAGDMLSSEKCRTLWMRRCP